MVATELITGMEELVNHIRELEAENKKLKKRIEEDHKAVPTFLIQDMYHDTKEENEKLFHKADNWELKYHTLRNQLNLSSESDEEDSDDEELSKYEKDDSGWVWAYGYTIKDGEYRINISGGGDHWEDYVITKNGCFIHNKEGKKKVFTFVSCPEGKYIKVWDTPHMEGGLVLDEGESDIYEMVKECYEEEIMNYDSESEEESDDEEITEPESDKP